MYSPLLAQHDEDILVAQSESGIIQVGSDANGDLTTRIFEGVFTSSFDADDPGFDAPDAGGTEIPDGAMALPPNESLWIDFVPFSVEDGVVSSLFSWDGNGVVQFSPAPATYELLVRSEGQVEVAVNTNENKTVPIALDAKVAIFRGTRRLLESYKEKLAN